MAYLLTDITLVTKSFKKKNINKYLSVLHLLWRHSENAPSKCNGYAAAHTKMQSNPVIKFIRHQMQENTNSSAGNGLSPVRRQAMTWTNAA